ncbi:LysR family transcriptional regulator [Photobacterium swingsii]|uniref:LysR family transcriptional regulator n=1 Tax=Photobacterium swingsii TaxID=680026 RepID=A0A0J8V8V3_9GAMM|nr:LysR family transcriptional regulator [Photobacterium swingsii]KMV29858.1 LysR family transcriptional regulator [Photobacterium swingsii]PSW26059.1 LysR family transcriptional regulator [Photobacterium swingsii]
MIKKAQQMIVFNALTKQQSFTKAAQLLDISRTQVSKQIQQLEERLGVQLVQRTTRSFALTEEGQRFAVHCENIASEINDAESELLEVSDTMQGLLRVGIAQSFARHHIAPFISEFHEKYPQLDLELSLFDHRVDLIAEQLDLWIGMTDSPPEGFVARHLADCHFVLAASPDYLARNGVPYTPEDLSDHNCITYYSRERKDNVWSFTKATTDDQENTNVQLKVKGNFRVDSADAILDATLTGNGVGYLATYLLEKEFSEGKLVRLLPDWTLTQHMPLYAVYPRYKFLPKKVHAFIEFVRHHIGEPVYWDNVLR